MRGRAAARPSSTADRHLVPAAGRGRTSGASGRPEPTGAGRRPAIRARVAGLAAVLVLGAGLAGCGGGDDRPSPTTTAAQATTTTSPATTATAPTTTTSATDPALAPPDPDAAGTAYLALGDSLAQGVQRQNGRFATTREGYPDQLATLLERAGTPVTLSRIGCSGATVASLLDGDKRCSPAAPVAPPYENRDAATSQLAYAETYLKARGDRPTLVTIDIGANDLLSCAGIVPSRVRSCFADRLPTVERRLAEVAKRLKAAAGPNTVLAAMTYYDPAVALIRQALAKNAALAFHEVVRDDANPAIRRVFAAEDFLVARVDRAFDSDGPADDAAVDTACRLTRLCGAGADFHPNAEGYGVIAKTFEGVVRAPVAKVAG